MQTIYLVCFIVGLALSLFLAVAGDLHFGGHVHDAGGHAGGVHDHGGGDLGDSVASFALSFLSPIAFAGAALLFGGVGLLLGSGALSLPLALVAGFIGAIGLRALMRAFVQSSTAPLALTGEGAIGTINATIRPGSPGEVIYTLEGLHRSVAARSVDNAVIPRGTQVVITRREGGFAWVEPLNQLESLDKGE